MNHLKLNNPGMHLFVASMGKIFKVTAIAKTDAEANEHCERNRNEAVVACDNTGAIYIAEQYGAKCPSALLLTP